MLKKSTHPLVKVPKKKTLKALKDARNGNTHKATNFHDLCLKLGIKS